MGSRGHRHRDRRPGPRLGCGNLEFTDERLLQIRLAVHVVLACVRRCSADLENLRASTSVPQIFQVRQQESKGLEQGAYRKSGSEQGCARLPESIKLRSPSSPKLAALSSLVTMPYLVSSPALARHPSAHLLIIRHPALTVLLRTAVARRGDALSPQAARQSCPFTRACVCSAAGTSREARRASAGCAASRLAWLVRPQRAWSGSWLSWSAPCMPSMQPKHTAPLHPLFGRAGDRFRTSDACMHGR